MHDGEDGPTYANTRFTPTHAKQSTRRSTLPKPINSRLLPSELATKSPTDESFSPCSELLLRGRVPDGGKPSLAIRAMARTAAGAHAGVAPRAQLDKLDPLTLHVPAPVFAESEERIVPPRVDRSQSCPAEPDREQLRSPALGLKSPAQSNTPRLHAAKSFADSAARALSSADKKRGGGKLAADKENAGAGAGMPRAEKPAHAAAPDALALDALTGGEDKENAHASAGPASGPFVLSRGPMRCDCARAARGFCVAGHSSHSCPRALCTHRLAAAEADGSVFRPLLGERGPIPQEVDEAETCEGAAHEDFVVLSDAVAASTGTA